MKLRGFKGNKTENDEAPLLQQVMYEDIWKRDEYFQWIYERLLLMKELLSETGSIYVHLDWTIGHYVKIIMDEIFGEENFLSEIIWYRYNKIPDKTKKLFFKMHDSILMYAKNKGAHYFQPQTIKTGEKIKRKKMKKIAGNIVNLDENIEYEKEWLLTRSVIDWIPDPNIGNSNERQNASYFPTLKPEKLLELFISSSSPFSGIVLDCFIGSGTTAAVAQKLGRRWIGVDINKGAVQITAKRLRKIIGDQLKNGRDLFEKDNKKYFTFAIYKANSHPFQNEKTDEEKDSLIAHEPPRAKIEVKRINKDTARIEIKEFISPTIIKRLNLEGSLLQKTIEDFRSMIDFILIDPNYDGKILKGVVVDIPQNKKDLIKGVYEIKIPIEKTKVAIKIVDILGDETIITKEI